MKLGPPLEQIPELPSKPMFNIKYIPSVQSSRQADVHQLTSSILEQRKVHNMRLGTADLRFSSSPHDPLGEIPIHSIVVASSSEQSFVLPAGEVVFDFLEHRQPSTD